MLGVGLALSRIRHAYARTLATSLKRWIPTHQYVAVVTNSWNRPHTVDAATDSMTPGRERADEPQRTVSIPPLIHAGIGGYHTPTNLTNCCETDSAFAPVDQLPLASGLYFVPPGFGDHKPMEATNYSLGSLSLGHQAVHPMARAG